MICAIYARRSNEQVGVSDDQKSVTRQIDHARQFATARGWIVADEHIYLDDGISGAEFATRPGFLRLMNALKPTPPFQVLIMSEESRLGREQIEVSYALKQLVTSGVRVFCYLTGRSARSTARSKRRCSRSRAWPTRWSVRRRACAPMTRWRSGRAEAT